MLRYRIKELAVLFFATFYLACGVPGVPYVEEEKGEEYAPGQTEFNSSETNESSPGRNEQAPSAFGAEGDSASNDSDGKSAEPAEPPQGREGEVEEADIYRVDKNRLFYLNTYRGLLIYDVNDTKSPKLVSRVPVYGYPIEMYVKGDTLYALVKDALYLTQESGKLKFDRQNVSQLVSIDISDLANPKVLQTIDIEGLLREGVSRKIEDTIYVVSYMPKYYYRGWSYYYTGEEQKEKATVYSFNVGDPKNLVLVDKLQVLEGGGYYYNDNSISVSRYFQGVAISATSNSLMVVENWYSYTRQQNNGGSYWCSDRKSEQQAIVSVIDISDPYGKIRTHTKFETSGSLTDQFKQTYIFDETTGKGTYYGIFARREWNSSNCESNNVIKNTLESWDITDGDNPTKLDDLEFGKPNETVRGSVFDPDRKVAFAITARAMDPLYSLSIADPSNLKILSEIDGLSGDMNVFRFIGGKKFLVGIGRDNSAACEGFGSPTSGWSSSVAVSIIDVQDLNKIRLVERKCVAVKDASFVGSSVNWNLDQAHKMIGMHSDQTANVITVPVYYYTKSDNDGWWWYEYKTAVGMMTWDLDKYDSSKSETEQNVLQNFGTVVHPKGQVRRTIVFTHEGATNRRMMINLSDTHISLVDIDDLNQPKEDAMIEVAPYYSQLYRFGDYMVEHIQPGYYSYGNSESKSEFRVKAAGGNLEGSPILASFSAGQVERVVKFKDNLVLFRRVQSTDTQKYYYYRDTELEIYSLADPLKPVKVSTVKLTGSYIPYYWYWCGSAGFWGGYWFNYYSNDSWVTTDHGLVFYRNSYDYQTRTRLRQLVSVNLDTITAPKVEEIPLSQNTDQTYLGLVPDPAQQGTFLMSYREPSGSYTSSGKTFTSYKYYALRYQYGVNGWLQTDKINLPGQLMKTFASGGETLFLTYDYTYFKIYNSAGDYWQSSFRLNLLRQIEVNGKNVAEFLDDHKFYAYRLQGVTLDENRIVVNARHNYSWYKALGIPWSDQSDQLQIFDISKLTLDKAYDEPTGTYNMRLMGINDSRLFMNLPGDGVLAVDLSDPKQPTGLQFVRTLGWASHIEFGQDTAYIAAGYFGIYQMNLKTQAIPTM
jgi:hypothetical protein